MKNEQKSMDVECYGPFDIVFAFNAKTKKNENQNFAKTPLPKDDKIDQNDNQKMF